MWLEKIPVKKITLPAYAAFRTDAFNRAYGIREPYKVEEVLKA